MPPGADRDARFEPSAAGPPPKRRYVLVCRGPNCKAQGSNDVRERLVAHIAVARDRGEAAVDVVVLPYTCFDRCGRGPNVVVYPDDVWYEAVGENDADDIVRHVVGGTPVEHLRADVPARHAAEYRALIEELIPEIEAEETKQKRPPGKRWWPFSR